MPHLEPARLKLLRMRLNFLSAQQMKVIVPIIGICVCSITVVNFHTLTSLNAQTPSWEQAITAGEQALLERDFKRAETHFQFALKQAEAFGTDNSQTAKTLIHMSRLYRAQGDYAKPESLYRESLRIARRSLGSDHPDYAVYLNEIGRYYHTRRKYNRAEKYYKEAFAIRVKEFGREHAAVAESIGNMAVLYENLGLLPKANIYNEHALAIREKVLGADHIDTVTTLEHSARVLQKLQRSREAQVMEQRAHAARKKRITALSPPIANIGGVYSHQEVNKPAGLTDHAEPEYTDEARIARHEGTVVLLIDITPDGRAQNFRLLRSLGLGLDEKAVEAIRQWRFNPARKDGKKVTVVSSVEVNFRLL